MDSGRALSRKRSHHGPNKKPRISPPARLLSGSQRQEASSEESSDEETGSESSEEIDETERKLESLVFGNQAGFHDALKSYEQRSLAQVDGDQLHHLDLDRSDEGNDSDGSTDALAGVADEDLFFIDSGPAEGTSKELSLLPQTVKDAQISSSAPLPAWEDSDDERVSVPLAKSSRLRKLRVAEGEDVVDGKEYVRRLRLQFERLHPSPDWVRNLPSRNSDHRGNKHNSMGPDQRSDSSMNEDTDTDEDSSLAVPPLGKILQNSEGLTTLGDSAQTGRKALLRQGVLDIQRLKDVGGNQPSSVDSLSFHPHHPLLLSSGPASTLYLHHVSPQSSSPNPLLTSLHVRRTPIRTSTFYPPSGNKIIFSGRRRFFHVWDLDTGRISKVHSTTERKEEQKSMERFKPSPCGRWIGFIGTARKGGGLINIINAVTGQWVAQFRVDSRGGVADFAWWSNGEGVTVAGKSGEVSEWDGRLKRVVARWMDQGAVGTTVLCMGGQSGPTTLGRDRWIAIGSSSGVVNLYDRKPWASSTSSNGDAAGGDPSIPHNPKPVRIFDQLTTPISHMTFSADGQLLVIGSRWKKDALRLIHLPSCTVFQNWPTSNTPLGRISAVAVSPQSDLLGVANEQGKIRLWQIHG